MEFLASIPAGAWALVGTIVGSIGLKVVEKWLNRHKDDRDERRDFREEIRELVERVDRLEDEVTTWRERYYAEQEQVALLRTIIIKTGGVLPEVSASKTEQDK